jgi:hypothetical protein
MELRNSAKWFSVVLILSAAAWAQDQGLTFHWSGKLSADQVVEVKNINGTIEAEAGTGDEVQVTAEKSGPKAEQVQIKVVPHKDGVTICAIYPPNFFGGSSRSCEPGNSWHSSNVHTDDTKVHFVVHLPRNLRLSAQNINGDIQAADLGRAVHAASVNGSVRVSTDAWTDVDTVNGSIEARMGSADWTGQLKIHSVNGSVRLQMPNDLSADVKFNSVNGKISSDFPITISGGFVGHSARGTVGKGGRELEVDTVNGSIELKKGSSI